MFSRSRTAEDLLKAGGDRSGDRPLHVKEHKSGIIFSGSIPRRLQRDSSQRSMGARVVTGSRGAVRARRAQRLASERRRARGRGAARPPRSVARTGRSQRRARPGARALRRTRAGNVRALDLRNPVRYTQRFVAWLEISSAVHSARNTSREPNLK